MDDDSTSVPIIMLACTRTSNFDEALRSHRGGFVVNNELTSVVFCRGDVLRLLAVLVRAVILTRHFVAESA
jgi:hypothetical protein